MPISHPNHATLLCPAFPQQQKAGGSGSKPALSLFSSSSSKPASPSTPKATTPVSSSATTLNASSLNGRSSALGAAASSGLTGSGKPVRVTFTLQQELPFGQSLKLVGSHPALGEWGGGAREGGWKAECVNAQLVSALCAGTADRSSASPQLQLCISAQSEAATAVLYCSI